MIGFAASNARRLSAGQQAFAELNQEMLGSDSARHSADEGLVTVSLEIAADPTEVERTVSASPLGRVMLSGREHGLIIGDAPPSAVEITASSRSWRSTPAFQVSGRSDYIRRHVGVGIWYGERTDDQKGDTVQYVRLGSDYDTYSNHAEWSRSRSVIAKEPASSDRYYRRHKDKQSPIGDRKLLVATQTLQSLFELRPAN